MHLIGLLIALVILAGSQAAASDRMRFPLPVALMVGDTVLDADVDPTTGASFRPHLITFTCRATLKGKSGAPCPGRALVQPFSSTVWVQGPKTQRYLLTLREGKLVDDASMPYSAAVDQTMRDILIQLPAWSAAEQELEVAWVPHQFVVPSTVPLDGSFLITNRAKAPISLTIRRWPRSVQTYVSFEIADERGARTLPQPHPDLSDAWLKEYESITPPTYDLILSTGAWHVFGLPRINSAQRGWGYKQELDYQFYPLGPGTHQVKARLHGLIPGTTFEANPVRVVVAP